jgi:hypothetical protein
MTAFHDVPPTPELGILARRRVEAEIIKPIYDILVRELGQAHAADIIGEAVSQAALSAGQQFAAREPRPATLRSFMALQPLWEKDDALTVNVLNATDTVFDYDVTRCRYAEMYQAMGLGDIGHLLSCQRDSTFIEGYAPQVALTRTHTIMEGASRCDFRYRVAGATAAPAAG